MNDIVNNKKGHNFMNDKNYWFIREYLEISSIYEHYKWQKSQNCEWHRSGMGWFYERHYEWHKVTIMNDTEVAWDDFMNDTIMNYNELCIKPDCLLFEMEVKI